MDLPESLAISSLRAAAESMGRDGREGRTGVAFQIWTKSVSYPTADVMTSAAPEIRMRQFCWPVIPTVVGTRPPFFCICTRLRCGFGLWCWLAYRTVLDRQYPLLTFPLRPHDFSCGFPPVYWLQPFYHHQPQPHRPHFSRRSSPPGPIRCDGSPA